MAVAWVLKRIWSKRRYQPLMLELPPYRMPSLRNLGLGLWERASIFLRRVGGIIFTLMVVLWFLSSFPAPPAGATGPAIQYSVAGMMGRALEHVFAPIGFNWQISIALVPGLAAREVAVGALGTVYSMSAAGDVGRRRAGADHRQGLVARHRVFAARLVRVRAAVPLDAGRRSSARPTRGAIR